ncbi:HdeD family acid-resistance protein [Actinocrispum wychmicini]|uniref:Uncharacterized membrane protein HdeD (DUF308 family) n=1 Tax=Actinocrispum wychmicini TaxID=1213861 RepID=A0A4R2JYI9_9PSEU|nr:HdeD family acid-resistance protein [Actinocrispum wychmicini]TCO62456.1 uncharacterized membrane protein HdeD (DUF308 family) [Actinocrispum wychmicini]
MSDPVVVLDPRRAWGLVVLRGVMALLFGLFSLIWPEITVLAFALLFGIYALADGIGLLMDAFRNPDKSNRGIRIAGGVLGIVAGILAIAWPGLTVLALAVIIGVWAIITGFTEMAAAFRLRKQIENEILLGLAGLVSVIFGVVVLAWPLAGAVTIAAIIGIFALVYGVVLIGLGIRLRTLVRA